ncbi:MAG: alpha/beta hydrolase [Pseudomonadota bacterium]
MKRNTIITMILVIVVLTLIILAQAHSKNLATLESNTDSREVPARLIPVPKTVSPELKEVISRLLNRALPVVPNTTEEWRKIVAMKTEQNRAVFNQLIKLFPVDIKEEIKDGVKIYTLTPPSILEDNKKRVMIHLRGGGYVFNGGETGMGEAVLMAYYGKIKVISVDYRMAPDFPFPAALEDSVAIYKEVLKIHKPQNIGIFGTSAGGGLTMATVFKLRDTNVPLPGAVGLGTLWADLTKTGDTLYTNEDIDDVLVTYDGFLEACARMYAGSSDMKDPFISPVYGNFSKGFPPTILTAGTRDMLLSDTVRVHRKLRQAGVEAYLQVFEGMSHAQYITAFTSPESREAFQEMALFFRNHLGK